MDLAPPRGTRDFFPKDLRLRNWLFGHFREVSRLFGFEEYDAPVVESEELYTRKAGEEIVQQLYTFEDKSGRRLALRPEMTPSLARVVLQRGKSLSLPIKWFSIPQCWRYERMTRGRRREHYQWNLDIFGVAGVNAEAELLSALTTFFTRVGLGSADVAIKVSSRKLLQAALESLSVPADRFAEVCVLVDKLEKVPPPGIEVEAKTLEFSPDMMNRIREFTSSNSLEETARLVGEDHEGVRELRQLFTLAGEYGFGEWLQFDASLVRGLAYYTGTVFEAFDRGASLRAICGGGRYDRLLSTFGGEDIPACGLGFGDPVIIELLKDKGLLPELPEQLDDVVFAFDPSLRPPAMQVANRLRQQGRSVDLILEDRKLKWAFKHADGRGASRLVLLAPDEWAAGKVRVKDLKTGEERDLSLEDL
ncbi:MAG: histidine--tRNA ligase [Candidatus Latescibacteria bacterium]|nr:histidine--tRNA ligase [Candidatus Latescibacterota bacterium]